VVFSWKRLSTAVRARDLVTLILKTRMFSSAAFALTLESRQASEDQNHHPERSGVTPAVHEDLSWIDDLLN
jgi:hypothetical protein